MGHTGSVTSAEVGDCVEVAQHDPWHEGCKPPVAHVCPHAVSATLSARVGRCPLHSGVTTIVTTPACGSQGVSASVTRTCPNTTTNEGSVDHVPGHISLKPDNGHDDPVPLSALWKGPFGFIADGLGQHVEDVASPTSPPVFDGFVENC